MSDIIKTEIKKVFDNLQIDDRKPIVVAFSGGVDSVCLLHSVKKLGLNLVAAHVNHSLRDEADSDEQFCKSFAKKLGVRFVAKKFDINKFCEENGYSVEEGARIKRYEFLQEVADGGYILTAHHKDDNLETILLNLFRGAGAEGIKGIEPIRGNIMRPMLSINKSDILAYAEENSLNWVEDKTNQIDSYARNNLRINVIPFLKEKIGNDVGDKVLRFSELVSIDNSYIKEIAEKHQDTDIQELNKLHYAVKSRVIRNMFYEKIGSLNGLTKEHVDMVLNMCSKGVNGKKIEVPGNYVFEIVYGKLIISSKYKQNVKFEQMHIEIPMRKKYNEYIIETSMIDKCEVSKYNNENDMIFINDIYESLFVRSRAEGDWIRLKKNGLKRSIKKLFIDRKIEKTKRDSIPLIASGHEILWIHGVEKSMETAKWNTDKLICIKIVKDDGGYYGQYL